jgi:hypothetical protein
MGSPLTRRAQEWKGNAIRSEERRKVLIAPTGETDDMKISSPVRRGAAETGPRGNRADRLPYLRCQHPPSVCSHSPCSQLFLHGMLGGMANSQDMHFFILADRERASYERWLPWDWAGHVRRVWAGLRAGCARLWPPRSCSDDDPWKVAADALGNGGNDQYRMDYPGDCRLHLPISSATPEPDQADEPSHERNGAVLEGEGRRRCCRCERPT